MMLAGHAAQVIADPSPDAIIRSPEGGNAPARALLHTSVLLPCLSSLGDVATVPFRIRPEN